MISRIFSSPILGFEFLKIKYFEEFLLMLDQFNKLYYLYMTIKNIL